MPNELGDDNTRDFVTFSKNIFLLSSHDYMAKYFARTRGSPLTKLWENDVYCIHKMDIGGKPENVQV